MRPLIAFAILLLAISSAAPELDYTSLLADYPHRAGGDAVPPTIEIESSTGRADRLSVAALQTQTMPVETFSPGDGAANADPDGDAAANADAASNRGNEVSLDDLCNALYTSAQDNGLPIPFFANLIWQESRLRDDAVSRKGALGIAQFMPETAAETGLDDPFDPLQAISASARLLNELRLEFGNLGFVAAAYNAGARRVVEWLEHRGSLPRETRGYVVRVTGLSVEAWRSMAVADDAVTFVSHLPCRSLPAFASLEEANAQQARLELAVLKRAELAIAAAPKPHGAPRHAAERKHGRDGRIRHGRREARSLTHDRRAGKREAAHHPRFAREKHTSV